MVDKPFEGFIYCRGCPTTLHLTSHTSLPCHSFRPIASTPTRYKSFLYPPIHYLITRQTLPHKYIHPQKLNFSPILKSIIPLLFSLINFYVHKHTNIGRSNHSLNYDGKCYHFCSCHRIVHRPQGHPCNRFKS